jgi:WhiB family transcriptional regulator, redox-sensing transcriptional regulator
VTWWESAACLDTPLDMWHGRYTEAARRVCFACPVRNACLTYALDEDIRDGLYGGLDPDEREPMRRARRARRAA